MLGALCSTVPALARLSGLIIQLQEVCLEPVAVVVVDRNAREAIPEGVSIHKDNAVCFVIREASLGGIVSLFPSLILVAPGTLVAVFGMRVSNLDKLCLVCIIERH